MVDLFDRNANDDEFQTQQICHCRCVGRKERRELLLVWTRDIVTSTRCVGQLPKTKWIVSERAFEPMHQCRILPTKPQADKFDTIAPGSADIRSQVLQKSDRIIGAGRPQYLIVGGRQSGGLIGTVVERQIACEQDSRRNNCETTAQVFR